MGSNATKLQKDEKLNWIKPHELLYNDEGWKISKAFCTYLQVFQKRTKIFALNVLFVG